MARHTFFSFHYQRDVFRVNQIRKGGEFIGSAAAGFVDASLWEKAKQKGDAVIKAMIDDALVGTSVTVVCIGAKTARRTYINYEIEQSLARGNGMLGLRINHLVGHDKDVDPDGDIPALLVRNNVPVYRFTNVAALGTLIERAYQSR
ncbi:TIR domain-containing protein [Azospirillum rugosum]|uniref:TIR domain-containing protein n=1 Tax=Azospirillum rugosum TaxID=416170 RepID=UPI0036109AB3